MSAHFSHRFALEARKLDHTDAKNAQESHMLHFNFTAFFQTVIVSTLAHDKYIEVSFTTPQVIRAIFD